MKEDTLEKASRYLDGHHVMSLATYGPEGLWAAAVFYASEAFNLYFLSMPSSRHGRNLETNSQVAVTIQEDYRDWPAIRGIQLEGTCEKLSGGRRAAAFDCYRKKFPVVGPKAPPEIARALEKIAWYAVAPTRAYFIDNSAGFSNREEIPI